MSEFYRGFVCGGLALACTSFLVLSVMFIFASAPNPDEASSKIES